MNYKLIDELKFYIRILEEKLEELQDERQELVEKFEEGKALTRKERKRNKELTIEIKKVNEAINYAKQYKNLEELYKSILSLVTLSLTKEEASEIIDSIVSNMKEYYEHSNDTVNIDEILNFVEFEENETRSVATVKSKLEEELADLQHDLNRAKKRNRSESVIQDIENEISDTENKLKTIADYEKHSFDEEQCRKELNCLIDENMTQEQKQEYVNDIIDNINEELTDINTNVKERMADLQIETSQKGIGDPFTDDYEESLDEDLDEDIDEEEEKTFGEKTKDKLNKVGGFLNNQKKKIVAIAGVVILGISILFVAKSCSKSVNRNDKDKFNNPNEPSVEDNVEAEETDTTKTIQALVEKGYNEYIAGLMVQNFDESVINDLLNRPYIPALENYVGVSAYPINLDYIEEYEQSRTTYNLLSEEAVDFVNRAHNIYDLKFYDDASILEIVDVLCAIDHKDLMTQSNASLAQSFNTTFNRITDNYLFGTVTEDQISKMDAIQYFAKDGSDMHAFLKDFGALAKDILEKPNDNVPKDSMYKFINIFATSLNGFTNVPEALTRNNEFNENAQVIDYYDWFMAYNSFIAPLYPIYGTEETFVKYAELQNLMITALEGPEFEQLCGEARAKTIDDFNGNEEIIEGGY